MGDVKRLELLAGEVFFLQNGHQAEEADFVAGGKFLENEGRVLFFETSEGFHELPAGRGLGSPKDARSLKGCLAAKAVDAQLGFLFAVWDDAADPLSAIMQM